MTYFDKLCKYENKIKNLRMIGGNFIDTTPIDNDMITLAELINKLYQYVKNQPTLTNSLEKKQEIFKQMNEWFHQYDIAFTWPLAVKDTSLNYDIAILKYEERNNKWFYWMRQCRGAIFLLVNNQWVPYKYMLLRGAELLTSLHRAHGIKDTENIQSGNSKHLSLSQQNIVNTLMKPNEAFNGTISFKKDGSLFCVSIIMNDDIAQAISQMIGNNLSARLTFELGKKITGFPVIFSSSNQLIAGEDMLIYFIQSVLSQYVSDDEMETYEGRGISHLDFLQEKGKTGPSPIYKYGVMFFTQLKRFVELNSPSNMPTSTLTLSFETVIKNRTTVWQFPRRHGTGFSRLHYELAISYDKSSIVLLGLGISSMNGELQFLPHFRLNIKTIFKQPAIWMLTNTEQITQIMNTLSLVMTDQMTQHQFFEKLPPSNLADNIDMVIDFEGFVLYTLSNTPLGTIFEKGDVYEYNKLKTPEYYASHHFSRKNIDKLISMSKYNTAVSVFPHVKLIRDTINKNAQKLSMVSMNICGKLSSLSLEQFNLSEKHSSAIANKPTIKFMILVQTDKYHEIVQSEWSNIYPQIELKDELKLFLHELIKKSSCVSESLSTIVITKILENEKNRQSINLLYTLATIELEEYKQTH